MFTGLIKEIGIIKKITPNNEGCEIVIASKSLLPEIHIDDSVAVNGCCLTATKINSDSFVVQAVHVTLEKTSIGKLKTGSKVNLELALKASDRLGGHFVQGHVNGTATIHSTLKRGNNYEVSLRVPSELKKYMIQEGSIALDGISLTLAKVDDSNIVTVSIIPHTWDNTILHDKKIGDIINVEVDVFAKYLENFFNNAMKAKSYNQTLQEFMNQ